MKLLNRLPFLKERLTPVVTGECIQTRETAFPREGGKRDLFVDASRMADMDGKSGIPRVTRSILFSLMNEPPAGFRVVPVFASKRRPGYFVLEGLEKSFMERSGVFSRGPAARRPIDFRAQDVFFCLDYNPTLMNCQQYYLAEMQKSGVAVYSLVHDLLPIQLPEKCPPGLDLVHAEWLRTILRFNGAVCVSRTVAEDLLQWVREKAPGRETHFHISWFRLGADFEKFPSLSESPPDEGAFSERMPPKPFVLMVGTVEARKGYSQALGAFEALWERGVEMGLAIAGREGWRVGDLVERMKNHEQSGKRLFWFEDLSDGQLIELYKNSAVLLMASEGEGFGLPLVEAARLGVPLIARDLPVLREVTGGHAFFFSGQEPEDLEVKLREWFQLYHKGRHPKPARVPCITWAESTELLVKALPALS
jgi:glycosyltransferase involved in cell wall biosynthesis